MKYVLMKHPEDGESVPIGVFKSEGKALEAVRHRLRPRHEMHVSRWADTSAVAVKVEGPEILIGGDFGTDIDGEYRYRPVSERYEMLFEIVPISEEAPYERHIYQEIDEDVSKERSKRLEEIREAKAKAETSCPRSQIW